MKGTIHNFAFEVTSGRIHVTDPCYTRELSEFDTLAVNGEWRVKAHVVDQGGEWAGERVVRITARLANSTALAWEPAGLLWVDSGQMGIFDDTLYPQGETGDYEDKESFYGLCCHATTDKNNTRCGTIAGAGFVSSSGYGDGEYPVEVIKDKKGRAVAVRVTFISEEDE